MEIQGLHHVAIAVESLDDAVETYCRLLGAEVEHRETLESQGVEAVFLRIGTSLIELLAPLRDDTPVGRFLASRGPGMHHLAFHVADAEASVATLAAAGAQLIDEQPRAGLNGHAVAFVHPESMYRVLVEVVSHD